jgi:hypothetical protein
MTKAVFAITNGAVSAVLVDRNGEWSRPSSEAEWDEVFNAVGGWVDEERMADYYEARSREREAVAERRAAGIPDHDPEPF